MSCSAGMYSAKAAVARLEDEVRQLRQAVENLLELLTPYRIGDLQKTERIEPEEPAR